MISELLPQYEKCAEAITLLKDYFAKIGLAYAQNFADSSRAFYDTFAHLVSSKFLSDQHQITSSYLMHYSDRVVLVLSHEMSTTKETSISVHVFRLNTHSAAVGKTLLNKEMFQRILKFVERDAGSPEKAIELLTHGFAAEFDHSVVPKGADGDKEINMKMRLQNQLVEAMFDEFPTDFINEQILSRKEKLTYKGK